MRRKLAAERQSHFFKWFALAPDGPIGCESDGSESHGFRPSGTAFHDLVRTVVWVDDEDGILRGQIEIDGGFLHDPRNGVFARDFVKSFLEWAVTPPTPEIDTLIANIFDLGRSGSPIIIRNPLPPPPTPDSTGAYEVLIGQRKRALVRTEAQDLVFESSAGPPAGSAATFKVLVGFKSDR